LIANVALVALAAAGLWRWRIDYRRAADRYQILRPAAKAAPAPSGAAAEGPAPPPVQSADYFDAAGKFLFSPDRNPTVVIEPPKLKPRPELPQVSGVMNIGGGPIALMAMGPNRPHKPFRVGDKVGEFELLDANSEQITLRWEGETIHALVADLLVRAPAPAAAGGGVAPPSASSSSGGGGAGSGSSTLLNPDTSTSGRPGEAMIGSAVQTPTGTIYMSLPGDNAPAGTVYQGKRKVVRKGLFGAESWWEDIKP
jgi:hypothetical protein